MKKPRKPVLKLPEDAKSLDLLQRIYRSDEFTLTTRLAAAEAAIPYECPKYVAIAIGRSCA
jgi:hypothetical protein